MIRKKNEPAPAGSTTSPNRAKIIGNLQSADDTTLPPSWSTGRRVSPVARKLASRCDITLKRAALVVELMGLKGEVA